MNILFMSLSNYQSVYFHGLYTDLLRQFIKDGNKVFMIAPFERRSDEEERIIDEEGARIVKLRIWNMQKTSIFEKGISMLTIENIFVKGIKKYFYDIKFDLVLYPTPPITLLKAVEYIKKRDGAKTYLLLKDIFPQNAVDIGIMSTAGVKGLIYKYFRRKEKMLYKISDYIGCMSPANVEYVLAHNPDVRKRDDMERKKTGRGIVEVCPNCIEPIDASIGKKEREEIREKYSIPPDKTVFVYGGNLGKPQGIDFMLKCLHSQRKNDKAFFLIVGNGTEYGKIERYVEKYKPKNIALHQWLPKDEYNKVVAACDVGMIFLDHRFTIPNFPSRLLSYMSAKLPVLAVTDTATDIGKVIVDGGFGWWCESNNLKFFSKKVNQILKINEKWTKKRSFNNLKLLEYMGENAGKYLRKYYSVDQGYEIIMRHMGREENDDAACRKM